ncbi:MAG: hypothetical protein WCD26_07850, partial [Pseudolabrys sp.]
MFVLPLILGLDRLPYLRVHSADRMLAAEHRFSVLLVASFADLDGRFELGMNYPLRMCLGEALFLSR